MLRNLIPAAALAGLAAAGTANADYRLNILHFNDFHSRFEPVSKYDSTCSAEDDAAGECFGGVARMKTWLDTRRAALAGENTLTLQAGDLFQGTLFYTTFKGSATVEIMNLMGLDAMMTGNHEFDDGPSVFGSFIDRALFPVLSGNVDMSAEPLLAGKAPEYLIKEVGGEKIAIIGVLATDTAETASPGPNVKFNDEITYLNNLVPKIEAQGINKIILLSHVGYVKDQEIAATVPGIDVIVGGHSHTFLSASDPKREGPYPTWVNGPEGVLVPIVTAYAYSRYMGDLAIDFDDNGVVQFAAGDAYALTAEVKPDQEVAARVAEFGAPLAEMKKREVGEVTAAIDGDRTSCRARECEMGNLVATAMLESDGANGATIAIANGGGIRASIDAGPVTMGEVLTVLPFQNTLATAEVTGAQIIAALENGVSQVEEGGGRFPQVAGLRFAFDPAAAPGARIRAVEIPAGDGWAAIDESAVYKIVTNNYMRNGGDGYAVFKDAANAYDYGPNLEETVAAWLSAHSPWTPSVRGVIVEGDGFGGETAAPVEEAVMEEAPAEKAEMNEAAEEAAEETAEESPAPEMTETAMKEEAAPEADASPSAYIVAKGDSLWTIAKKQLGDATRWTEIQRENGLAAGAVLEIGQELRLPE